jgi:hypothetical protein
MGQSASSSTGQPEVLYVDLFGRATRTNRPIKERVIPRKS